MRTVIAKLLDHQVWIDYLELFERNRYRGDKRIPLYEDFILNKKYTGRVEEMIRGEFTFPPPRQYRISKINSEEKRSIYAYPDEEQLILKILNRILMERGIPLSPLCHSFQRGKSAKSAFSSILGDRELHEKQCLHIDIKNYFNSINSYILLEKLPPVIRDDLRLFSLLKEILLNEGVINNGNLIRCSEKGVMAGTPLAPLLSNFYLKDLDEYFRNEEVNYTRYSDDIILFDKGEKIEKHLNYIKEYLKKNRLLINKKKFSLTSSGDPWTFLGFKYHNGEIDISDITLMKIKGKISRASRKYSRARIARDLPSEKVLGFMLRKFQRKLFGTVSDENLFSWSRWFFPLITTDRSLKSIDRYMQEKLRYAVTGRHSKKNYREVPYNRLRDLGYVPLVSAYYLYRNVCEKYFEWIRSGSLF